MDVTGKHLQIKFPKVCSTLASLWEEISTATKFLQCLQQHSANLVKKLHNISSPMTYLKEYSEVNLLLLQYISLISEINCKFEMLKILECNNCESSNLKKTTQQEDDDNDANQKCLKALEKYEVKKEFRVENLLKINSNENDLNSPKTSGTRKIQFDSLMSPPDSQVISSLETGLNPKLAFTDKINLIFNESNQLPFQNSNCFESMQESLKNYFQSNTLSAEKQIFKNDLRNTLSVTSTEFYLDKTNSDPLHNPIPVAQSTPVINDFDSFVNQANKTVNNIKDLHQASGIENQNEYKFFIPHAAEGDGQDEILALDIPRKLGEEMEIVIENVRSPSEFYVHFIKGELNLLEELEKELKSVIEGEYNIKHKNNKGKKTFFKKNFGSYALYFSKCDEIWCRAKVTDWRFKLNDDLVIIFLVDYGDFKCVSLDCLRPMPKYLKKYPAFAQRCHLYGIRPSCDVDDNCGNTELYSWRKDSTEKMKYFTEKSKNLKIRIVSDEYSAFDSLPVILLLADEGKCVNNLLLECGRAVPDLRSVPINCILENENLDNWNPMKEEYESYRNSYDLNVNDPASAIYGYIGTDDERICRQYGNTGLCYKGKTCRKEHEILNPSGYTVDQEGVYKNAFNRLVTPKRADILNVQVTVVLGINKFYCIPSFPCRSDEESLPTLNYYLNCPENLRGMRHLSVPPSTGQIVLAKYSEDEVWYRAKILESQPEKDQYFVFFVDYGNKEYVSLSRIRAIEPRYLHLPFQAMLCYIFGIEMKSEGSSEDGITYLNARLEKERVSVEVISKFPGDEIILSVRVMDEAGRDIGEDLVDKNFADRKEEMIVSDESEVLPG